MLLLFSWHSRWTSLGRASKPVSLVSTPNKPHQEIAVAWRKHTCHKLRFIWHFERRFSSISISILWKLVPLPFPPSLLGCPVFRFSPLFHLYPYNQLVLNAHLEWSWTNVCASISKASLVTPFHCRIAHTVFSFLLLFSCRGLHRKKCDYWQDTDLMESV